LDAADQASPVEAVEAVTRELGVALGATQSSFLIADMSGRALVRLAHVQLAAADGAAGSASRAPGQRQALEESATVLPFDGGPAERAIRTQRVQVVSPDSAWSGGGDGYWLVLAPVTERGEAIGVLELTLPARPDAAAVSAISRLAHVLAFVVIANRRHTDLYEWGQRTRPLSLSAEIQNRLLPGPQTCEAGAFTLAGWLEPAAAIAGDTFDFNLARDVLHLSLTDAMGHGVPAALTATLCVGGLRNARSAGASLLEQVTSTNQALVEHAAAAGLEDFVTGVIGRVDLRTGTAELVNAGHLAPYLVRDAISVPLDLPSQLPLGLFANTAYRTSRVNLQPATGWCSSPTAWSNATPSPLTSRQPSSKPGRCTQGRQFERWPTGSWKQPGTTSATTRPSCAWTARWARATPRQSPWRRTAPRQPASP
jgi:hypothetical protein